MKTFDLICYIIAGLCFLLAFFSVSTSGNVRSFGPLNFVGLGLLAWVLVPLVTLAKS